MSSEGLPGLIVCASGAGSNFKALCEAARSARLPARILALITNVAGTGAASYAIAQGIPIHEIESRGRSREEHEALVDDVLARYRFDWIVLAGYMRLFTAAFIRRHPKIVNIHPSLLPSFPGTRGYLKALQHGAKVTGATVHLVGEGLDDGPIVAQAALEVHDDDDEQ